MEKPLLSVIVPAYNIAPWLPRCLDSILAQTYENLELIVVNDGSTDDTAAVLQEYALHHERVTVIRQENRGVTAARLQGLREAKGEWIGFIDGDDEIDPEMYARLLKNAANHHADISHCGHQVIFPDGHIQPVHGTGTLLEQNRREGLKALLDGGKIDGSLCSKVFRRRLFDGIEDWMDPAIRNNEDLLMNYHLFSRAGKTVWEDVCLYHYLLREGSASHRQLNEHALFDPLLVREKIQNACETELRNDAMVSYLRWNLFVCAQLSQRPKGENPEFRTRARELLKEKKSYFSLLSFRNRILANMIVYAPWSFRLAYGLYVKLFGGQEEH